MLSDIAVICCAHGSDGNELKLVKLSLDTLDFIEIHGMGSLLWVKQGRSFCQTTCRITPLYLGSEWWLWAYQSLALTCISIAPKQWIPLMTTSAFRKSGPF